MTGYKARTVLAKTAGLNFLASVIMIIWHIVDGRDPDGTLIALVLVLFLGGTIIAGIRHDSPGGRPEQVLGRIIDRLVDGLIASRIGAAQPLRLVDPQETEWTIPARRRSAP